MTHFWLSSFPLHGALLVVGPSVENTGAVINQYPTPLKIKTTPQRHLISTAGPDVATVMLYLALKLGLLLNTVAYSYIFHMSLIFEIIYSLN